MKKGFILLFLFFSIGVFAQDIPTCQVIRYYKGLSPDINTKAITQFGDIVELETLLVPIELDEGRYEIQLTNEKQGDLYKMDGTDYYIETEYCMELAVYSTVTLRVYDDGYYKGKIYFSSDY